MTVEELMERVNYALAIGHLRPSDDVHVQLPHWVAEDGTNNVDWPICDARTGLCCLRLEAER